MTGLVFDILRDRVLSRHLLSFLQCLVLFFNLGVLHFVKVYLVFLRRDLAFVVTNLHVFVEPVALTVGFLLNGGKLGCFFLLFDALGICQSLLDALGLGHGFLLAIVSQGLLLLKPVAFLLDLSLPVREIKVSIDALLHNYWGLRQLSLNLDLDGGETYLLSENLILDLVTHSFSFVLFGASLGQFKFLLGFDLSFASYLSYSVGLGGKFLIDRCLPLKQFFLFGLLHLQHFGNSVYLVGHGHLTEPWLRDRRQLGGHVYHIGAHIAGCSPRILLDQISCGLDIV